jgi:hypothetical protein
MSVKKIADHASQKDKHAIVVAFVAGGTLVSMSLIS